MIGMWIGQAQRAIASGERIFVLLDEPPEIADPAEPVALPAGGGELRFEDVDVRLRRRAARARGLDLDDPGRAARSP